MERQTFAEHFDLEDTHWWFRSKRTLVFTLLRRYGVDAGPGLDVGSGAGGTLARLAAQGAWFGVDADPAALELSRRRGLARLAGGSAEALPFRGGTFAACLCLDLLYHRNVGSETGVLRECHRVLRPGGLLLVTDSAFKWLKSAHDEAVHGARRGRAGGSDVYALPGPLNTALLGVQAIERGLLRLGSLPFGSSVVLVARKEAA